MAQANVTDAQGTYNNIAIKFAQKLYQARTENQKQSGKVDSIDKVFPQYNRVGLGRLECG